MSNNQNQNPYSKACELLGITPRPALKDKIDADLVAEDAFHRLTICIKAKNLIDGKVWTPVHDGSERHYYPWFYKNNKDSSGLGLSYGDYDYGLSNSLVGSRLEYRTYKLAREGAEEFKKYYADFMTL